MGRRVGIGALTNVYCLSFEVLFCAGDDDDDDDAL